MDLRCRLGDVAGLRFAPVCECLCHHFPASAIQIFLYLPHAPDRPSTPPHFCHTQNFSHCVSNGGVRGKVLLADRLEAVIDALYPAKPQLVVKYALPAALALANDTKGGTEVKAAANQLLAALGRNMGQALVDHAATLPAALQQRVMDVVLAGGAGQQQQRYY